MRIITIFLCFFFIIDGARTQTVSPNDGKRSFGRNYVLPKSSEYNTWDLGGHFGITYPYTDISASGSRDFAFGIDITKFLSHSFALQTRFLHGSISGVDEFKPDYQYNTTFSYDLTLNAIVNFGNLSFIDRNKNLSGYASIGFGIIHFSPTVYTDGGHVPLTGVYSQYTQPLVTMDYSSTTNIVIPLGVGLKYRVSDKVSINAEYSYRATNSDKLDGFYKLLSSHDNFSYFGVGAIYHLGKQREVLEWVNPMEIVYDDLNELKAKIIQLSNDTDKDGVPDINDREPETPIGNRVYGDGTSVLNVKNESGGNVHSKPPAEINANPAQVMPEKTGNVSQQAASPGTQTENNTNPAIQNSTSPAGIAVVPVPAIKNDDKPVDNASTLKGEEVVPVQGNDSVSKSGVIIIQTETKKDTVVQYVPDMIESGKPIDSISKSRIVMVSPEVISDSAVRAKYLSPERSTVADSIYRSRIQMYPQQVPSTENKYAPSEQSNATAVKDTVKSTPANQQQQSPVNPPVVTPPVSGNASTGTTKLNAPAGIDTTLLNNYNDLPSIYFTVDDTKIGERQFKTLEYIALVMQNNPTVNFNVIGICDGSGGLKYNIALGKKRAEAVVKHLVNNYHLDVNRFTVMTLGAVDSSVKGSAQLNRRVDIKVKD